MQISIRQFLPAICVFASQALALEPASHFSDHAVLQRDSEVPVWGTAAPGAEVSVSFAGQTVSGTADNSGKWRIVLQPMKVSAENRTLTIQSGGTKKTAENVLVGDVWLGSGQSNMAGKVASYAKNDPTLTEIAANAPYPAIRLMRGGPKPQWEEATPEAVNGFSAILFAFGERLHRDLDIPIGLIVGAVGGTPSGSWIPAEIYENSKKCKADVAAFRKTWDPEKAQRTYEAKLAVWEEKAAQAKAAGEKPRGRKPNPPSEPGTSIRGGEIGGLFSRYIRSSAGYAIRGVLWDQGEAGSGILGVDQHTCMSELIRGWRDLWGQGEFPFIFVQKPSGMGNAFSNENPITREANAFAAALPDISRIGTGEGRFLYTRLMVDNENAWMVPAIDLGSSVHPINKWGYGNRAAEVAEQIVYQMPGIQAYGPIYDSHTVDGHQVTVRFTQSGEGLVAHHSDKLQGFALAGSDGVWHWADATITGADSVVLSSEAVKEPKHVRFAYSMNRTWANLFNKNGLPALAFTTEPVE